MHTVAYLKTIVCIIKQPQKDPRFISFWSLPNAVTENEQFKYHHFLSSWSFPSAVTVNGQYMIVHDSTS